MIVVTGAAGFIGSNLVADLESQGRGPIVACDWFGTGDKWRNLAKRNIAAFITPGELPRFLDANAAAVTALIHLGAVSATTASDVDELVRLNIQASAALWDWCAERQVSFIYASSAAVYGDRERDFLDDDTPSGVAGLRPLNAYGWSKKAVDEIFVNRVARGERAPGSWVGLRFFNVYGPNEYHKGGMRSVALSAFEAVRRGEPPRLFRSHRAGVADGEQRRDFVYVLDCSRIIGWFLDHPEVSGIFNAGTGHARSFLDLAAALGRALDRRLEPQFIDTPGAVREGYQYFTQADMGKARARGMRLAFTTLEDGIADYVRRYLMQGDCFR